MALLFFLGLVEFLATQSIETNFPKGNQSQQKALIMLMQLDYSYIDNGQLVLGEATRPKLNTSKKLMVNWTMNHKGKCFYITFHET